MNGADSMVGLFINTLPVRARVPGSASLEDSAVASLAHSGLPCETTSTRLWHSYGIAAMFPPVSLFLIASSCSRGSRWTRACEGGGGNRANRSFRLRGITDYALVVAGYGGSRLRIEQTYNRRRLADETVLAIKERLQNVIEEIVRDPRNPGGVADDFAAGEAPARSRLERHGNNHSTRRQRRDVVRNNRPRTPEGVALVFGNCQWTYTELNVRANRLAHRLRPWAWASRPRSLSSPSARLRWSSPSWRY